MERAIPKADKDAIEGRLAEVNRTLLPMRGMTNREKIGAALARMFSGFTNTKSLDPQTTIATYLVKLAELPAWAIEAAIYDVERGRVDGLSPDFPPSAARVFQLTEIKLTELREEKRKIETLVRAKVEEAPHSPESVARVGAMMKSLSEKMGGASIEGIKKAERDRKRTEADHRTIKRNDASIILEYRMHGLEPVMVNGRPMSLSLARATGAKLVKRIATPEPGHGFSPGDDRSVP
jgi:hypothetical protein